MRREAADASGLPVRTVGSTVQVRLLVLADRPPPGDVLGWVRGNDPDPRRPLLRTSTWPGSTLCARSICPSSASTATTTRLHGGARDHGSAPAAGRDRRRLLRGVRGLRPLPRRTASVHAGGGVGPRPRAAARRRARLPRAAGRDQRRARRPRARGLRGPARVGSRQRPAARPARTHPSRAPAEGSGDSVRCRFCTWPEPGSSRCLHRHRTFAPRTCAVATRPVRRRIPAGTRRRKGHLDTGGSICDLSPSSSAGRQVVLRRPPDALLDTGGPAQHLLVRLAACAAGVDTGGHG